MLGTETQTWEEVYLFAADIPDGAPDVCIDTAACRIRENSLSSLYYGIAT